MHLCISAAGVLPCIARVVTAPMKGGVVQTAEWDHV